MFIFSKKHFCEGSQQIGTILFLLQLQAQAKDLNIPHWMQQPSSMRVRMNLPTTYWGQERDREKEMILLWPSGSDSKIIFQMQQSIINSKLMDLELLWECLKQQGYLLVYILLLRMNESIQHQPLQVRGLMLPDLFCLLLVKTWTPNCSSREKKSSNSSKCRYSILNFYFLNFLDLEYASLILSLFGGELEQKLLGCLKKFFFLTKLGFLSGRASKATIRREEAATFAVTYCCHRGRSVTAAAGEGSWSWKDEATKLRTGRACQAGEPRSTSLAEQGQDLWSHGHSTKD